MNRKQLEKRFSIYPDVVTLQEFRQMLGGIGDKTARKLVRENRVKHYYIRNTYLIPKTHVIDYLLSTHYTIEGNTVGDSCQERSHPVGDYQIIGFGVPTY